MNGGYTQFTCKFNSTHSECEQSLLLLLPLYALFGLTNVQSIATHSRKHFIHKTHRWKKKLAAAATATTTTLATKDTKVAIYFANGMVLAKCFRYIFQKPKHTHARTHCSLLVLAALQHTFTMGMPTTTELRQR